VEGHVLGRGSSATVYSCKHKLTGGTYAAKKVSFPKEMSPEMKDKTLKEIQKEVEILKQLHHKNIVTLFGWYQSVDEAILFMELFDATLKHVLHKKFVNSITFGSGWLLGEEMSLFCGEILEGLVYLHSKNVAHRDLKVNNYFERKRFLKNNRVKISCVRFKH
jgi:serine/threonine protein kinase